MRYEYFKSLIWVVKLQFKTSPLYSGWGLFRSVFDGVRSIVATYALANLISSVSSVALQKSDEAPVYFWFLVLFGVQIVENLVRGIDSLVFTKVGYKIDNYIEQSFSQKTFSLSQEQFDDEEFSTKLERARKSMHIVESSIDRLYRFLTSIISFLGSIIALVYVSPIVAFIIVLSALPTIIISIKTNKQYVELDKKVVPIRRVANGASWLLTSFNKMPEIRLMNGFNKLITIWQKNTVKYQDMYYKNSKDVLKKTFLAEIFQPFVAVGANVYFFKLLVAGVFGLDRFIFLRGMLDQSVSSVISMSKQFKSIHADSIEINNFMEIFNTEPTIKNGTKHTKEPLKIEFKNVSFKYPSGEQLALDDVSFTMEPGMKVALVGENGAGKSTIIKLMLRQYLPTSGNIFVNGIDIQDIEPAEYSSHISNLSQEYLLIDEFTIRENLLIGLNYSLSDRAIYKATDLVGATDFIQKLPNQLSNRLDSSFDDGSSLSGGQRQRIALARALLSNGYLMILDEPTSSIDAKAEYNILNNIYKFHEGKTTLIVSHRFNSVRKADKIIVLENGKIIQTGNHEELMKKAGLYKEMFEIQAEGYK